MAAMPAVLDESSHAGKCVGTRHAMQVAAAADDVFALFQFPDLAPIDAFRDRVVIRHVRMFRSRRRVTRRTDWCNTAHAPAGVGFKPDDVPHLKSECVIVFGDVGPVGRGELGAALCHGFVYRATMMPPRSAPPARA